MMRDSHFLHISKFIMFNAFQDTLYEGKTSTVKSLESLMGFLLTATFQENI